MRRRAWSLVLALSTLLATGAAHAQSAPDVAAARDLFVEASKRAGEGDWKGAEERYARSLALKRSAVTLYSLGVAQRKSGHLVEALESFRAFLLEPATASSGGYLDPAKSAIAELDPTIPRFVIDVAPVVPDLELTLDGAPIPSAALGLPRLVNPGAHVVVAKAKGRAEARVERTATEGATEKVHLELGAVAAPVAPPPAAAAPLAPRDASPAPASVPPGALAPLPPAPSRAVPFTLIGVGAAIAGAGLAIGLSGVSQALSVTRSDGPEATSARTRAAVGDVMVGAGIVAAAVGVGLLVFKHDPRPPKIARWVR